MNKNYCSLIACLFLLSCFASHKTVVKKSQNMDENITRVIAHRGAWKNTGLPENSVAALKAAINEKCYGSEMDVHMTSDGYVIVNHDPHFHGVDIQNSTLAQLREYKLSNGEELPLLSDFLKIIAKQKVTKLIIEIKTSQRGPEWGIKTTDKVIEEVNRYKAASQVEYISFGFDICKRIKEMTPDAIVQYLNGEKSPREIRDAGLSGIDYHYSVFQRHPEYLEESRKLGIITNAWTVNDAATMDWLIAHGTNFITTNEPELLARRIAASPVSRGYSLAWSDEFLYTGLPDSAKWNFDVGGSGWGNNEKQYYTQADTGNATVKDGVLNIVARKEKKENSDYTSARLVTRGKASWTYGYVEARIKLPAGEGLWPAFWMLGNNISQVGWPACGEIDIMEHVGYQPDSSWGTIHTEAFNHMKGTQKGAKIFLSNPYNRYHTYSVEWTPEEIRFYVDENHFFSFKNEHKTVSEWPFDSPFYLILNVAVGGNLGGKIDDSIFPAILKVDYVRVFQKK